MASAEETASEWPQERHFMRPDSGSNSMSPEHEGQRNRSTFVEAGVGSGIVGPIVDYCAPFRLVNPTATNQVFVASMMLISVCVGMTLVSFSPAASNSVRYSLSVRSRPPVITSMFRSMNLLKD